MCLDHEEVCEDCGFATCRECMKPCKKCDMEVCTVCREHHAAQQEERGGRGGERRPPR
jgi:hypothetical protein